MPKPIWWIVTACLLISLQAGCGSSPENHAQVLPQTPISQTDITLIFPQTESLSQLPARETGSMSLLRLGSEFNPALPNNRVLVQSGDSLLFNPDYVNAGPIENLSYAIYDFNTSGYSAELGFHFTWLLAPPAGETWLGLANYATARWEWYPVPESGDLAIGSFDTSYQSPGGLTYAAVILAGKDPAVLSRIRLGINVPPQAALQASAASTQIGGSIDFDAGASLDPDGTIVKYEFDPTGGGSFTDNALDPLFSYQYNLVGSYQAAVRVTDSDGATATQSIAVAVTTDASGWVHNLRSSVTGSSVQAWDSLVDEAGNVYLCGQGRNLISTLSARDGFVAKYSPAGQLLWSYTYADDFRQNSTEVFSALAMDSQGGLFAAGCSQQGDSWVMLNLFRLNPDTGDVIWAKEILGLFGGEFGYNAAMAVDGSDHLVLSIGEINSGTGNNQLFVIRYTADGQIDWSRHWETVDPIVVSGLAVDSSNNIYLAGTHDPYLILNAFVCSLDSAGTTRWAKSFDAGTTEAFNGVTVSGGNVYCAGRMDVAAEGTRGMALKLTPAGEAVWCESYDNAAGRNPDSLFAAVPSGNGGVYISGTTSDAGGTAKSLFLLLDADGLLQWQRSYGIDGEASSANAGFARGADGALYFCGIVSSFASAFTTLSGSVQTLSPANYTLTDMTDPFVDYSDTDFFINPIYNAWISSVEDDGGAYVMRYYE